MNKTVDKWGGAKFIHFRDDLITGSEHYGGATVAYWHDEAADITYVAVAHCHPKDRFIKGYGRQKSYGLLKQLHGEPQTYNHSCTVYESIVQFTMPGKTSIDELVAILEADGYERR